MHLSIFSPCTGGDDTTLRPSASRGDSSSYLNSLTSIHALCGMPGSNRSSGVLTSPTKSLARAAASSSSASSAGISGGGSSLAPLVAAATEAAYSAVMSDEAMRQQRHQILFNSRLLQSQAHRWRGGHTGRVAARTQSPVERRKPSSLANHGGAVMAITARLPGHRL